MATRFHVGESAMGRLVVWRDVLVAGLALALAPLLLEAVARADGPLRADGVLRGVADFLRGAPVAAAAAVVARRAGPGRGWAPRVFVTMALAGALATLILLGLRAAGVGGGPAWRVAPRWVALAVPAAGVLTGLASLLVGWGARRAPPRVTTAAAARTHRAPAI